MLKGKNIVIVGLQSWDIPIGSNCKNIATELAKNNRVIYINVPLDRKNYLKWSFNSLNDLRRLSVLKGRNSGLIQLDKTFYTFYPRIVLESINWLNNPAIFDYFNKRNAKKLAKEIQRITKYLGFENYILFNDSSMYRGAYFKDLLKPECYIYYIRDNLITQNYFKKHGVRLEAKTINAADLVVSNSPYLRDYAKTYNVNSFYIGQGCDLSLFRPLERIMPVDLAKIEGVKIGYVGSLTSMRLDINLLIELANENMEWQIILVGPEDDSFKESELHKLKNVHFLGNKREEELPHYVSFFDVCINPQLVNDLTVGNYPRKIDEYLAMGKATVATSTPTMEIFKDYVYLASSVTDYSKLIKLALKEDNEIRRNKRITFAKSHTWENNIIEIEKAIITRKI